MTDPGETTARDPWAEIETYKTAILRMGAERSELLSRVADLEAQKQVALELHRRGMIYTSGSTDPKHKPSTEFRCTDDHLLWPCPTARALGGEKTP